MPKRWLEANEPRFVADILRDFCMVSITLEEQFARFDRAGNLSFPVLRDLLGDMMDKGLLWRLKDMAHHVLRDARDAGSAARLLDWAIGYIFHETIKLMEDAHQQQYYTPGLSAMAEADPAVRGDEAAGAFGLITNENTADMRRGVDRIRRLLTHARSVFRRYYADQADNRHLARLLHDREDLIRTVFGPDYDTFIAAVYNGEPERLYLEAAAALLEGGRVEEAAAAARKAESLAPDKPGALAAAQRITAEVETSAS